MHAQTKVLLSINLLGGLAVLASYAYGFARLGDDAGLMWGGVPTSWRPGYTASMLAAAAGYFPLTLFLLRGVDPDTVRIAGRFGFATFHWLYLLVLVPSALWLPLTCELIDGAGLSSWIAVRVVLAAVGIGSLGILAAVLTMQPARPAWAHRLAIVGAVAFLFQTGVLDALVWPAYFPR